MGLRVGTMQAPRRSRCANAQDSYWHVQARHHGGYLGRTVYRKPFPHMDHRSHVKPSPPHGSPRRLMNYSTRNSRHTRNCYQARLRRRWIKAWLRGTSRRGACMSTTCCCRVTWMSQTRRRQCSRTRGTSLYRLAIRYARTSHPGCPTNISTMACACTNQTAK